MEANVCQTHATAIAKNNGTHRTYFDSNENYKVFCDFVCRMMRCYFPDAGVRLQELLVLWLRSVEETRAADWFERYWCGPIKGRWLLANGGIAITANNQGLESTWHWDRISTWPTARDTNCVGKEWGGLGEELGGLGKLKTDFLLD